ncbi:MAG: c-type cytochrome [Deltaproteobacteria bacterium]|jgi:ubiquinol-cytochrome c reductase cytochrome b subunit|nr:c-type cytochrome [Deltaproteobacteria bacterium]
MHKATPFYPNFLLIEAVCALLVLAGLVLLAFFWQVPLEEMADPGDSTYVPRPEWYFLFYFQLLKYFEGALIVVGVFILPVLFLTLLVLLPFLDKGKATSIRKRPVTAAVTIASVFFIVALTFVSVMEDESHRETMILPPITEEQIAAGEDTFGRFCTMCHAMDGKGGFMAPDLTQIGARANRAYIERVILNPQIVNPATIMSLIPLSDAERHEVSAYLSRKK